MNKNQISELFYKEKNYSKIKELLNDCNDSWSFNLLAKIALKERNTKTAYYYFEKASNLSGCAYCKFLDGNLSDAQILLTLINDYSEYSKWLFCLINFLNNNFNNTSSYFQIRNFYEQDLAALFFFGQKDIIDKIVDLNGYFERYNKEVYKYTGRVFYNNNLIDEALKFLKLSLDIVYKDPEVHYLLGEIYEKLGKTDKAREEYQKAVKVNGFYFPASKKLMIV
ncbi:tetratricopeptide repeat protein [bacterium]|nr:tetratricopeptide repeat protein [bacterium]